MTILAVDPGTICTGWALAENKEIIKCDKIHVPSKWEQSKRLAHLMWGIDTVLDEYSPDIMVIEDQFVGRNARTSLTTARAKGIAIACAAARGITVIEYAPSQIKAVVTGKGNANKDFVMECIIALYGELECVKEIGPYKDKGKNKTDDIFDALGILHTYLTGEEGKVI